MTDRKKIIQGLEHEIERTKVADTEWLDCVEVALLRDALTLLKAQEPRLVTEADFENADAYGFCIVRLDLGNGIGGRAWKDRTSRNGAGDIRLGLRNRKPLGGN